MSHDTPPEFLAAKAGAPPTYAHDADCNTVHEAGPRPCPPPAEPAGEKYERFKNDLAAQNQHPSGPQPIQPGPYHAVVRGPNGLDFALSGSAEMVGHQLVALGQKLAVAALARPAGPISVSSTPTHPGYAFRIGGPVGPE